MVLLYFYTSARQSTRLMFKKKITRRTDPPAGDKNKDYVNTLLVVAALVETVTFAAGGFNSSEPNQGLPTLAGDPALVHGSLNVALPSLFFALLCMPVAFYCGVFVVFARIEGLLIFLNVTSAIFIFLMLFLLRPHVLLRIYLAFLLPLVPTSCYLCCLSMMTTMNTLLLQRSPVKRLLLQRAPVKRLRLQRSQRQQRKYLNESLFRSSFDFLIVVRLASLCDLNPSERNKSVLIYFNLETILCFIIWPMLLSNNY